MAAIPSLAGTATSAGDGFVPRRCAALPRIAFLFNAQAHQILHGITIAERLALDWRVNVDILSAAPGHLALARSLTGAESHCLLRFDLIGTRALHRSAALMHRAVPPKLLTLWHARGRLDGYDAIALPERTSTIIRKFGVVRPRLIHLDHGAGDRAVGFDPRIALFDFALLAGRKHERRMLADRLIRPGAYAITGYAKFEAADRVREGGWRPFADDRPIILYNPHFCAELGSWTRHGAEIVRRIVEDGRFNLIVAPHVRLCDDRRRRAAVMQALAPYAGLANMLVDPGSARSIDMSYTMLADLYLGDVSSQIYEYLRTPRPCLFVDGTRRAWRDDPDYAHWHYGPVIDDIDGLIPAIADAVARHPAYLAAQRQGMADTFDLQAGGGDSARAAAAIAGFMRLDPR